MQAQRSRLVTILSTCRSWALLSFLGAKMTTTCPRSLPRPLRGEFIPFPDMVFNFAPRRRFGTELSIRPRDAFVGAGRGSALVW
jgi:hypothetical protein